MQYEFKCKECKASQTVDLSIAKFDVVKAQGIPCVECGGNSAFKLDLKSVQVSFKGDAWADKNYKEKKYRNARSSYMASRQATNKVTPTLQPNYKGEVADSWTEVKEAAAADGRDTASYQPLIHKERQARR